MAIMRVSKEEDLCDSVIRNQVAEVLMHFLPGIASGLKDVLREDEKIGHRVTMVRIRLSNSSLKVQKINKSRTEKK